MLILTLTRSVYKFTVCELHWAVGLIHLQADHEKRHFSSWIRSTMPTYSHLRSVFVFCLLIYLRASRTFSIRSHATGISICTNRSQKLPPGTL